MLGVGEAESIGTGVSVFFVAIEFFASEIVSSGSDVAESSLTEAAQLLNPIARPEQAMKRISFFTVER